MRYDLSLAWRNLRNCPVETAIPVFVIALAIALSVAVVSLADAAEEGVVQASDPFGVLVIGSAGSGQQLVLSSVLLQGNPIGNISYEVYQSLKDDPRVRLAVPLALGDNVGGARIIGTSLNFFELRVDQTAAPAFRIAQGSLFDDANEFDAVLGSDAARRLGLGIGEQFQGTHGVGSGIAENVHQQVYTVVGILQASGTAYDSAVYTQLRSVWDVHSDGDHAGEDGDHEGDDDDYAEDDDHVEEDGDHAEEDGDTANEADEHQDSDFAITGLSTAAAIAQRADAEVGGAALPGQVTSVLVLPAGFIEQNQIVQEFYVDPTLQAAFPGQELGELLSLLSQSQRVLNLVSYLVLGIAALTVFLSMYNAVLARQQSIAIMRSLGSRRSSIFRIIIFETLIVSLAGAILGRFIGYGVAALAAGVYSQQSAIPVSIRLFEEIGVLFGHLQSALNPATAPPITSLGNLNLLQFELLLWVISIVVGLLAGLIPAAMAYRVNVVEKLFPS